MHLATIVLFTIGALRLRDNPALEFAIARGGPVVPLFVWAPAEDGPWAPGGASRWWLDGSLRALGRDLHEHGSRLIIRRAATTAEAVTRVAHETGAACVAWQHGFSPGERARDALLEQHLAAAAPRVECVLFNAHVLVDPDLADSVVGRPPRVFAHFWRAVQPLADAVAPRSAPVPGRVRPPAVWPESEPIDALGLRPTVDWAGGLRATWAPGERAAEQVLADFVGRLDRYADQRDIPGAEATSRLSPYLHFGEIGPRQVWAALSQAEQTVWLPERDAVLTAPTRFGAGPGSWSGPGPGHGAGAGAGAGFDSGTGRGAVRRRSGDRGVDAGAPGAGAGVSACDEGVGVEAILAAGETVGGFAGGARRGPIAAGAREPSRRANAAQRLAQAVDAVRRELGWREFAYAVLRHYPHIPESSLTPRFDRIAWRTDPSDLRAWQRGQTGYPLVDAGLRQLWQTGWMPNRVRMVVASFLVKDLLVAWQAGARWFWDTLVDADLANNTLGWQWSAGSGADAAPFPRVFNPTLQAERYDPDGAYIRRWVPELAALESRWIVRPWEAPPILLAESGIDLGRTYPHPIVDHAVARQRALAALSASS